MNNKLLDKPLGKWTLQELKEWCDGSCSDCADCPFQSGKIFRCSLGQSFPCHWKLHSKPHWTKQDIEDAKIVKRLFPWAKSVSGFEIDSIRISEDVTCNERSTRLKRGNLFPSLKNSKFVSLFDILENEDD